MRVYFILACLYMLSCCQSTDNATKELAIPELEYMVDEITFDRSNSLWMLKSDSIIVSGNVTELYSNGSVKVEFGLIEGKREGMLNAYFPNGKLRFQESYQQGKLNGEVKRWTLETGHQLVAQLTYEDGKLNGPQKKWYNTGELHKSMQLTMGKEEGLQQAFRKNGALYANYEARNGRIFGLKRSNLCYELDNEQVVYKQ